MTRRAKAARGPEPRWGKVISNRPGPGHKVIVFSPDKSVWAVCSKYLKPERGGVRWRTAVIFSSADFMAHAYVGPGDDKDVSDQLRDLQAYVGNLIDRFDSLSTTARTVADEGFAKLGGREALLELSNDLDGHINRLDPPRGRGAPSRAYAKEFVARLKRIYDDNHKSNLSTSAAAFLAEFESAFLKAHGVAIGVEKRLTRGYSEGSRTVRGKSK